MSISSIPPNTASAITPFNPLGKATVSEEEKDSKNSSLKAVEESAHSHRNSLRQDGDNKQKKVDALGDEDRDNENQQRKRKQQREQAKEQEEIRQLAPADPAVQNPRVAAQANNPMDINARSALSDNKRAIAKRETTRTEKTAEAATATISISEQSNKTENTKVKSNPNSNRDLLNHHQLNSINRRYLDFNQENNRPGGIVSEAV